MQQRDDAFRAEAGGGEDAAQRGRAVAHDRDGGAVADPGGHRRVPPAGHHLGQGGGAGEQFRVDVGGQRDQRRVGQRHPHRLRLGARPAPGPEPAARRARRRHAVAARGAGAVGPLRRHDDEVAGTEPAHPGAHRRHGPHRLAAQRLRRRLGVQAPVGPDVRTAHRGVPDGDDRVGRERGGGVGDVGDDDLAGGGEHGGAHGSMLTALARARTASGAGVRPTRGCRRGPRWSRRPGWGCRGSGRRGPGS